MAGAAVVLVPFAAVGWLYLLRSGGLLGWGPRVAGALPLQQLAGDDAQPLARFLAAWIAAGVAVGLTLARTTRRSRAVRAAVVGAWCVVVLVITGAASDAAAISGAVPSHLTAQLGRSGLWLAAAVAAIGAALPRRAA